MTRYSSSLTPHHAQKGGNRYSYYTCTKYQKEGAKACPGSRVPAAELESFVVEQIRAISADPALVADTIAAAEAQIRSHAPDIERELARLGRSKAKLRTERDRLVDAIAGGSAGAQSLRERIGEIEQQLAVLEEETEAFRLELDGLRGEVVDAADLTAALASFVPVWDELFGPERQRILRLLIEQLAYDARAGEVEISFSPGGVVLLADEAREDAA